MMVACGSIARAVVIACLSWRAPPRPEPVLPPRSHASAITGAAVAVDSVVINGDSPLRSSAPGDLGVPERGALFVVPVDRARRPVR